MKEQNRENQLNNSEAQSQKPSQKTTRPIVSKKIIIALIVVSIFSLAYSGIYLSLNSKLDKILSPKKTSPTPVACTLEAMQCPDGSYASRTGPNCEFSPCPTAKPTEQVDQASNWKTYGKPLGIGKIFEIKYPPDWKFFFGGGAEGRAIFFYKGNSYNQSSSITFIVHNGSQNKKIDQWVNERINLYYKYRTDAIMVSDIFVNRIKGKEIVEKDTGNKKIYLPAGIYVLDIYTVLTGNYKEETQKVFDQMLSTFRFTEDFSCSNVDLNPPELTFEASYCNGDLCSSAKKKIECEKKDILRIENDKILAGKDGDLDCQWINSSCQPNK